ncbi:MAG: FMN-binding protein [Gammaproteobacteria bacterium]
MHLLKFTWLIALMILYTGALSARGIYQTSDNFLAGIFKQKTPPPQTLWLTGDKKKTVADILTHDYPSLRVRYWQAGHLSAWILDETGKERPITVGIVVNGSAIETIRVLEFRESRGWEIRHGFFTDQFNNAQLTDKNRLDIHIDGISGATLSVRAMQRLATLALYLDSQITR